MTELVYQPKGLYFEEFTIGTRLRTAGRTITEADIVAFAGLSGDYNQIHTNAVYAAADTFGKLLAHSLLVQPVATLLHRHSSVFQRMSLAFRELDCKFSLPVYIGDTVHVEIDIVEVKALPRLKGGNVTMKYAVVNQDGATAQRGNWVMLVKSR